MASGVVALSDVVVPAIFAPYIQQQTQEKSRLIQSGAVARDQALDALLAGGGATFNSPSFKDLDDDTERSATDNSGSDTSLQSGTAVTHNKMGTATEIQVRLSRNNSWSASNLAADLIAVDPMQAIASRVSAYWTRRLQAAMIATMKGVFANNALGSPGGTGVQNDLTHDVSGASFVDGVTNFSAENFLDAAVTMGDSLDQLGLVFMHSIVYNRALKNNLIDFIPDSTNQSAQGIATFLGRQVVVDDGTPFSAGVFETWLFGAGAVRLGLGAPKTSPAVELFRDPHAGNGHGEDVLFNRVEWCIHPVGHKYAGTAPQGGPTNANSSNNLANSASFVRVYTERKQIKVARLITREF
jgi:hypothetical protein